MTDPTPRRLLAGLAGALLLTITATACGDDVDNRLPPPASPPGSALATGPTSALDPADAEAAEEILAAFDNYLTVLIELSTAGAPGGTEESMARMHEMQVGGEVFFELRDELLNPNFQVGHATAGTLTYEAEVTEIDWNYTYEHHPDEVVPRATLRVCFDETDWTTIDKATGDVVAGPGERYQSTVTVTWRAEDPRLPEQPTRWEVAFREDSDQPC